MTYGWAILVVLIAIGALAYFGVLRPERLLPEKCIVATGSGLFCEDYSVLADNVTIRIKNILADPVNITLIHMTPVGETCTDWAGNQGINTDTTSDFLITCGTITTGDKVKADIEITFNKVGGLSRTTTGQMVTTSS